MLVAGNFSHSPAFAQRLDRHLLLDRGRVLAQTQFAQHRRSYRSEAVLTFAEPALESPIDAGGDERASGQPQKLIEAAVQLARPAAETRGNHVVGLSGKNWLDEQWNVLRIVRSVRIEEDRGVRMCGMA
jgi:hypothetical protein